VYDPIGRLPLDETSQEICKSLGKWVWREAPRSARLKGRGRSVGDASTLETKKMFLLKRKAGKGRMEGVEIQPSRLVCSRTWWRAAHRTGLTTLHGIFFKQICVAESRRPSQCGPGGGGGVLPLLNS
jgi:hypothetical protein